MSLTEKQKKTNLVQFVVISVLGFVVLGFQNCGPSGQNSALYLGVPSKVPTVRDRNSGAPATTTSTTLFIRGTTTTSLDLSTTTTSNTTSTTSIRAPSGTSSSTTTTTLYNQAYPVVANCAHNPCFAATNLYRQLDGESYDLKHYTDTYPSDPEVIFHNGGSLNIPVIAAAGMYVTNGNPAWFTKYFDLQKTQGIGLQHREMFSPIYEDMVVATVGVVLNTAIKKGHTQLADKAAEWLRATWALHALAARNAPITEVKIVLAKGVNVESRNPQMNVYTFAMAGPRSGTTGGFSGYMFTMLSLAAGKTSPATGGRVWGSTLGSFLLTAGINVDKSSGLADLSNGMAASKLGISNADRNALKQFIESDGRIGLDAILQMIGSYKSTCPYTFIRTSQGIMTWLGTSQAPGTICNRNKGPYFAGVLWNNSKAEYLHLNISKNPAEPGFAYRDGNRICANVQLNNGTTARDCLSIPGGSLVYEISWTPNGLSRIH